MAASGDQRKSRTLHLTGYGGYDKMKVVTVDAPSSPGPNEVIVNIRATGINFAELMCRQGLYDRMPVKLPAVLGFEGSGDVIMIGESVKHVKVGDRVVCLNDFGLWTEYARVVSDRVFPIPESMTYEEAAAIPVNYITAYHMLFDFGGLRSGKSVLIHMAAGGVGTAASQLCKTVPNVTVFGTASSSKHEAIRKLGVDHPIDYRTQDYAAEIRKISPEGVDIVLDPLNGADAVKGFQLLKPLGKIIHFGAANAVSGPHKSYWNMIKTYFGTKNYSPLTILTENKAVCGYHLGHMTNNQQAIRSAVDDIVDLYNRGKIKPQIDSVWAFEDVDKAMARMHDRLNVGKVILSPQKSPVGAAAGAGAAESSK